MPHSLIKYTSAETAEIMLNTGTLRWSSPALFDEPWAVKHKPKLSFDHNSINNAMLKMAVSMIFSRDLPSGNPNHPLFKAIRRWRAEDRFKDEVEAYDALKELLAPTPETLAAKLKVMISAWNQLVENSRILCLSETSKDLLSWERYADGHRGLALKFTTHDTEALTEAEPMVYNAIRNQLTSVKEQVDDLVGIQHSDVIGAFKSKLLTKPKFYASEKEWRCMKVLEEDELDCGEDVEDWYMDTQFYPSDLEAVYFGFQMPEIQRQQFINLLKASYPSTSLYVTVPAETQYALEFKKL